MCPEFSGAERRGGNAADVNLGGGSVCPCCVQGRAQLRFDPDDIDLAAEPAGGASDQAATADRDENRGDSFDLPSDLICHSALACHHLRLVVGMGYEMPGGLGVLPARSKGVVVVAVDDPDLSPVAGDCVGLFFRRGSGHKDCCRNAETLGRISNSLAEVAAGSRHNRLRARREQDVERSPGFERPGYLKVFQFQDQLPIVGENAPEVDGRGQPDEAGDPVGCRFDVAYLDGIGHPEDAIRSPDPVR